MNDQHKLLNELITIQAGSVNTFFSYNSKSYKGSVLYVDIKLKEYLNQGLVRKIPFKIRPALARRMNLYQATKKGCRLVGREREYCNKDHQSYNNFFHESMKYDIALAFKRLYPGYNIYIKYEALLKTNSTKGIRVDILVRAVKKDGTKQYDFIVETEHKDDPNATYKTKVIQYQKLINEGLFKKNGLSPKTKVLFIYSTSNVSTLLRPQEYKDKLNVGPIALSYTQFKNLLGMVGNLDDKNFRFLPFQEFYKLNEQIWFMPSGIKVKIID